MLGTHYNTLLQVDSKAEKRAESHSCKHKNQWPLKNLLQVKRCNACVTIHSSLTLLSPTYFYTDTALQSGAYSGESLTLYLCMQREADTSLWQAPGLNLNSSHFSIATTNFTRIRGKASRLHSLSLSLSLNYRSEVTHKIHSHCISERALCTVVKLVFPMPPQSFCVDWCSSYPSLAADTRKFSQRSRPCQPHTLLVVSRSLLVNGCEDGTRSIGTTRYNLVHAPTSSHCPLWPQSMPWL